MQTFELEQNFTFYLFVALGIVKLWALIDAILRPGQVYVAADKQTKPAWMWILGLALVAHVFFSPYHFLSLIGDVGAFVYLIDAKPALAAVVRRRR